MLFPLLQKNCQIKYIPSPLHISDTMKSNSFPNKSLGEDITPQEVSKGGEKMGSHHHGEDK